MTIHDPRYYKWLLERAERRLQFFITIGAPAHFIEDEKALIAKTHQHTARTSPPLLYTDKKGA